MPEGARHVAAPGADVLLWPRGEGELVTVGCYVARPSPETDSDAGLAALALRSAARGAAGRDASELALAFERLGGALTPTVGADVVGFGVSVLAEHLAEAAALVGTVVREPTFRREDVAREQELLRTESEQLRDDMARWPMRLALGAAFGERGYGLPAGGTPESLTRLDAGGASAWYRAAFATRRTLVVAGRFDAAPASDMLVRVLAGPDVAAGDGHAAEWGLSPAPERERAERREKAQTAIAMIAPGPGRRDPARYAAETWAAIAGGLGGRMFEALRSAKSLAYTVSAGSFQRRFAGGLTAYIATSPSREEEARAGLTEELDRFRMEPPTPEELARATAYLAGQATIARQRTSSLASEMLDAWLIGEGLEQLRDPAAGYRAVTREAVMGVASRIGEGAWGVVRGG
jgi:zinc protease